MPAAKRCVRPRDLWRWTPFNAPKFGKRRGKINAIRMELAWNRSTFCYTSAMERVVRKLQLHEERIEPLIEDRKEAMLTFWEILRRGQSLYGNTGDEQGSTR